MQPTIQELLAELDETSNDGGEEKIANDASTGDTLEQARRDVEELLAHRKVASAGDSNPDELAIEKIASEIFAAEDTARRAEAETYGAAVFDGWIKRANQYVNGVQSYEAQLLAQAEAERQYEAQKLAAVEKTASDFMFEGAKESLQRLSLLNEAAFEKGASMIADLLDSE